MADRQDQTDGAVKERTDTKKQDPTLYKVLLINDDYSTMEFVIHAIQPTGTHSRNPLGRTRPPRNPATADRAYCRRSAW